MLADEGEVLNESSSGSVPTNCLGPVFDDPPMMLAGDPLVTALVSTNPSRNLVVVVGVEPSIFDPA